MATGYSKSDIPMKKLCQEAVLKLNAFHINKGETTMEKEEPLQTSTPETSLSDQRMSKNCDPKQDKMPPKTEIMPSTEIGPRTSPSLSAVQGWEMSASISLQDMAYQIPLDDRDLKNMSCSMFYPPPPPPSLRSHQDGTTQEFLQIEEANVLPQEKCASGCLQKLEQHHDSVTSIRAEVSKNAALMCSSNPVAQAATRNDADQVSAPVSPTHPLLPPPPTAKTAATGVLQPQYIPVQYPVYPVAHAAAAPSQPIIIQQQTGNAASQENTIDDRYGRYGYRNYNWIYLPLSIILLMLSFCDPILFIFAIPANIASLIILIDGDREAYPWARQISQCCTLAGCCCIIVEVLAFILVISIVAIIGATTGNALVYLSHFFDGQFE